MTAAGLVQAERRGAFWFVRLNRAERRNALCAPLLEALAQACAEVEADPEARAVVFYGAGGHFCAGADFDEFETLLGKNSGSDPHFPNSGSDPDLMRSGRTVAGHNRAFGSVLERVLDLPVPTLGVVRGAAMGGGCGLACALDRVIAADDAVFAMPEVTLGVAPAQVAPLVVRRIGATRARWLMLSGARLEAAAAVVAGLADLVAPLAALEATVRAELEALGRAEPAALRASKRLVTIATRQPLPEALDAAAHEFAALLHTGAVREGVAAARERRPPRWQAVVPTLPEFA